MNALAHFPIIQTMTLKYKSDFANENLRVVVSDRLEQWTVHTRTKIQPDKLLDTGSLSPLNRERFSVIHGGTHVALM